MSLNKALIQVRVNHCPKDSIDKLHIHIIILHHFYGFSLSITLAWFQRSKKFTHTHNFCVILTNYASCRNRMFEIFLFTMNTKRNRTKTWDEWFWCFYCILLVWINLQSQIDGVGVDVVKNENFYQLEKIIVVKVVALTTNHSGQTLNFCSNDLAIVVVLGRSFVSATKNVTERWLNSQLVFYDFSFEDGFCCNRRKNERIVTWL